MIDERDDAATADIDDDAKGKIGADIGLGWNDRNQGFEKSMEFFGCRVVFIQIGADETHTAGWIAVVELGEYAGFRGDSGSGRVFASGFTMNIGHGGDVVENFAI